jgi:electron transport complex protein RnfE
MAIALLISFVSGSLLVSLIRHTVPPQVRILSQILIIAIIVTLVDLLMQSYAYLVTRDLGLYLPLLAANCAILTRVDEYASCHSVAAATRDGLFNGLGVCLLVIVLSGSRELLGHGSLLRDAGHLFGSDSAWMTLQFPINGLALVLLPAGGLMMMGLVLAARNHLFGRSQ